MKIGLVVTRVPGYSETFLGRMIRGLVSSGHEVVLFSRSAGVTPEPGVSVISAFHVNKKQPFRQSIRIVFVCIRLLFFCPQDAIRFWKLERADGKTRMVTIRNVYLNAHLLLHRVDRLHFGFASTAVDSENAAAAMGAVMSVSIRGFDLETYPLSRPGCYRRVWQKVDRVHSISTHLTAKAVALDLPPEVPVTLIRPAVSTQRFKTTDRPPAVAARIITIGRLCWQKGIGYALDALAGLDVTRFDWSYTVVGGGKDHEELAFQAHQLGIVDRVTFAGKVSHEEISALLKDHDVYLQPSVAEGFGNAVLEAQAAGLVCIVSDAGGLPENIMHGETGFVVPRRSVYSLRTQLEVVLKMDLADRQRITANALARVKLVHSVEDESRAFEKFFC